MEILVIVAVAIALTPIAVLATSIYLYRVLAHRSRATILWLTNPRAPEFSVRSWEFDRSWPLIRVLVAWRLLTIAGRPGGLAARRRRRIPDHEAAAPPTRPRRSR